MIVLADPEKAAERHDGVLDLSGALVDHHIAHRPEVVAVAAVDIGALDLVGRDQLHGFVDVDRTTGNVRGITWHCELLWVTLDAGRNRGRRTAVPGASPGLSAA